MLERLGSLPALKEFIAQFSHPIVVTRGPTLVAVNDAWLSILGFRREQMEGRPYIDFMPAEERARVAARARLRAASPDKIPYSPMTSLALMANGGSTVVRVQPTPIPVADGEPFVLNFLFVIPERDAEIELAELLVATSSDLVRARTVAEVRELAVTTLAKGGYTAAFFTREGAPIHPANAALPPDASASDVEEAFTEQRPVFIGPKQVTPEAVIVPIQRGREWELFLLAGPRLVTPLRAALRLFAQGVASALDTASLIADLERRNQELTLTRAELVRHERLAALGEMAACVAHEVRNPVGVVTNAVTTLRRRFSVPGDCEKLLGIIDEECDRLARMVQDLLDFASQRAVVFTDEALSEIAEEAISAASAQPDPALRSVTFELECVARVPSVRVDRHLLRQALVNLLVNAAQASPPGGVVKLRIGLTDRAGEPVPSISVVDEGSGIAEPIAERIFEPFFTTRARGSGLGLAVVRRIVDQLRAEIHVDAPRGGGATFTLAFQKPLAEPSLRSSAERNA